MRVDLHNHTSLCNHASGSIEDYIKKAIELKINIYGFSDHAPMNFDKKYRMSILQSKIYEKNILEMKKKYANKIKILLAYEVDYLHPYILDEILQSKVDYLIGSVHFLRNKNSIWGFDNPKFIGVYKSKNIDDIWQEYFDAIEHMAKNNIFDIVGHFDLIKVFNFLPKKDIKLIALKALKAIKKSNMVLEINTAGLRKPINETYPSKDILELAFDLNINITFSSDAHCIEDIGYKYEDTIIMAKKIGFTKCAIFENRDIALYEF